MRKQNYNCFLFIFMIFNNIDIKARKTIENKITTKEYLRGEILFNINDLITSIAFIKRGAITVIDSNNRVIGSYNQNDIINPSLLFSSKEFYEHKYLVQTISTISFINKEDLIELMIEIPQININILKIISNYNIDMQNHIMLLSYKTIEEKLCAYLLLELKQKKASSFLINYTKTELASYLNVERHLLSLEIQKLINNGTIANQNKLYTIINKDNLIKQLTLKKSNNNIK